MRTLALCVALLGCSLRTEAPALINSYACNWQQAEAAEETYATPGYCWSVRDEWAAITPGWVDDPCDVDSFRLDSVPPATGVKVWVRSFRTDPDHHVDLVPTPGEDCK